MRFLNLGALSLLSAALFTGCCCSGIDAAREAARNAQSMNNMMQLALNVLNYQTIHETWPASLEDLRELEPNLDALLANPVTMDNPGYEYVRPVDENAAWSETVILYQLRNGARDMSLPVGYADGSVR